MYPVSAICVYIYTVSRSYDTSLFYILLQNNETKKNKNEWLNGQQAKNWVDDKQPKL